MATNAPAPKRALDMRAVRRLAIWAAAAVVALTIAVLSGLSEAGSRRLAAASVASDADAQISAAAQLAARSSETEAETRRLMESVRILATDRERIVARIGMLERNIEDLTGSIRRQGVNQPKPPTVQPEASPPPASSNPASATSVPTREAAVPPAGPPATPDPLKQSTPPAPAEPAAPVIEGEAPKAELGVDIGGAVTFEGLRALWLSTTKANAALFDGLHPLVTVRENNRTKTPELRLIAGPVKNAEVAARLCTTLAAVRRYCLPVPFEGERLAQVDVPPERKPPASPKSAPPAAAQRSGTGSGWPFR